MKIVHQSVSLEWITPNSAKMMEVAGMIQGILIKECPAVFGGENGKD